jgi:hypothetical protein
VATGALSPGEIASPLRVVLGRNHNTEVLLGDVTDIDATNRLLPHKRHPNVECFADARTRGRLKSELQGGRCHGFWLTPGAGNARGRGSHRHPSFGSHGGSRHRRGCRWLRWRRRRLHRRRYRFRRGLLGSPPVLREPDHPDDAEDGACYRQYPRSVWRRLHGRSLIHTRCICFRCHCTVRASWRIRMRYCGSNKKGASDQPARRRHRSAASSSSLRLIIDSP